MGSTQREFEKFNRKFLSVLNFSRYIPEFNRFNKRTTGYENVLKRRNTKYELNWIVLLNYCVKMQSFAKQRHKLSAQQDYIRIFKLMRQCCTCTGIILYIIGFRVVDFKSQLDSSLVPGNANRVQRGNFYIHETTIKQCFWLQIRIRLFDRIVREE